MGRAWSLERLHFFQIPNPDGSITTTRDDYRMALSLPICDGCHSLSMTRKRRPHHLQPLEIPNPHGSIITARDDYRTALSLPKCDGCHSLSMTRKRSPHYPQ